MMCPVWLAYCNAADYPRVLQELRRRDSHARVLHFEDLYVPADLLKTSLLSVAGAAVFVKQPIDSKVLDVLSFLASNSAIPQLLVFADEINGAFIAQLFSAGVTEIIAVEGAELKNSAFDACMERACASEKDERIHNGSDRALGDPSASGELPSEAEDRFAARMPQFAAIDKLGEADGLDEPDSLDEPDLSDVPDGLAAPDCLDEQGDQAALQNLDEARGLNEARGSNCTQRLDGTQSLNGESSCNKAQNSSCAPVVTAISGRGGVGKTTLIASMACCASRMGLRVAVIDLDLMFGDIYCLFGVDAPSDLAQIIVPKEPKLPDSVVEGSAMRVGPGLTVWGPVTAPEQAELLGTPIEQLIGLLRGFADVIFVDTSVFWGDAVAAAVGCCDRCLIVGGPGTVSGASAARAVDLAVRMGVPRTRMTGVVNRFGAAGCDEEFALRLELATSLSSRARVADGGSEVSGMLSFGRASELMSGKSAFAQDIQNLTYRILRELGCPVEVVQESSEARAPKRPRLRLPWKRTASVSS